MSIVRSLLISVGFILDRKSTTKTNKAIDGFKTKFSVAASAASYAFAKTVNFFGNIATAVLDANDLAKTLGISLREFDALQEAASKFGFRKNNFSEALQITQQMISEAQRGFGNLHKAARLLKINLDPNGSAKQTLVDILKGIKDFENEQERIKVAKIIFGENLGNAISDLSQNIDQFLASAKDLEEKSFITKEKVDILKDFDKALNELTTSLKKFGQQLTISVAPFFVRIFDDLTKVFDFEKNIFGISQNSINDFGTGLWDFFTSDFKKIGEKISEFQDKLLPYTTNQSHLGIEQLTPNSGNISNGGAVSIINNFEINNPPGTSDEQSLSTWQKIKNDLQATFDAAFRNIQNNNPVDE